jgi:hypothetical protein
MGSKVLVSVFGMEGALVWSANACWNVRLGASVRLCHGTTSSYLGAGPNDWSHPRAQCTCQTSQDGEGIKSTEPRNLSPRRSDCLWCFRMTECWSMRLRARICKIIQNVIVPAGDNISTKILHDTSFYTACGASVCQQRPGVYSCAYIVLATGKQRWTGIIINPTKQLWLSPVSFELHSEIQRSGSEKQD